MTRHKLQIFFNKSLKWIRYLIPNKKDLLQKIHSVFIFSKFDIKPGF